LGLRVEVPSSLGPAGLSFGNLGISVEEFRVVIEVVDADCKGVETEFEAGLGQEHARMAAEIVKRVFESLSGSYDVKGGAKVIVHSVIPPDKGLGFAEALSLAACYGLALRSKAELTDAEILAIASMAVGGGGWDHLTASYYGGFTWVNAVAEPPTVIRIDPPDWLEVLLFVPRFGVSKWGERLGVSSGRVYSYDDVSRVTSALSSLIQGLMNDDPEALREGISSNPLNRRLEDAVPHFRTISRVLEELGCLGLVASRSGPALMALFDEHTTDLDYAYKRVVDELEKVRAPYDVRKATIGSGLSSSGVAI